VSDGTRTHDRLDHNQELYQLSYAHREMDESTSGRRLHVRPRRTSASAVVICAMIEMERVTDAPPQTGEIPVIA
jgi:hypothetical protein